MSSNSTLDFADASENTVWFAGSFTGSADPVRVLSITNWTYNLDHLFFSTDPTPFVASQFQFDNRLTASYQAFGGGFEIIAVPEPGTVAAGIVLLGGLP